MITISDIESMSKAERLMAIDLIWSTLSESGADIPSPDWHGDVLGARLEKVNSGKAEFLSMDQLKERLNAKAP